MADSHGLDADGALDAAFRPSPSPPPARFLDAILNPVHAAAAAAAAMPAARSSRLPNGYVDLTSESDAPPKKRSSPSPSPSTGPSAKRRRRNHGAPDAVAPEPQPAKIEEIDLSDDRVELQEVLQRQRAEAVQAQQQPDDEGTTFNTFTCVICMDTPTDITATACGHLFCHSCLMEALIAGENRAGPGEPRRSQCPVCRKYINRSKQSDIIPLMLMKKGLATQPRKKTTTAAGKVT